MPKLSPRDIRRKIQGIKNTRRITNAMKVVSAAKLRRAQELLYASRPYSERLYQVLRDLSGHIDPETHPLLERREEKQADIIIITADRGLAGAFNSNLIKRAEELINEKRSLGVGVSLILIGRKGFQYFSKRGYQVIKGYDEVFRKEINFSVVKEVGKIVRDRYASRETDAVYLLNNEMVTRVSYKPMMRAFLPFEKPQDGREDYGVYEFEVEKEEFVSKLVDLYLNYQIYRAMVESNAAEHFARMVAMDNATRNADELVRTWTLIFNKARQEAITSELIDIVNAVEAMK
ncbi:ATP synthase F1, gamma subunit [Hydrogenobacter thermophilus TK-6]|uniref:ATP synthase gamma chain n=1 Tax=Hydrogenobacter thermophilus (strain DSM 6534 / IAM 12695 / TK-6) TaxID=608538 RepID=D3DFP0_HYDTT|nr:F0F1 ATP synthase subunit gamma [Hydrogenobacter thermophilus]ADO44586.1 ATP synthase F1, gamma subunit [Hydrogenobacter thermophilus TK-6]BAI68642.1 F0F1-type ATP synthase gamma subunit [Hydrogenobacter thermophilus TK-6]